MIDSMTNAMKTSISEVLETMFFIPLEFSKIKNEKLEKNENDELISCQLEFSGCSNSTTGWCSKQWKILSRRNFKRHFS